MLKQSGRDLSLSVSVRVCLPASISFSFSFSLPFPPSLSPGPVDKARASGSMHESRGIRSRASIASAPRSGEGVPRGCSHNPPRHGGESWIHGRVSGRSGYPSDKAPVGFESAFGDLSTFRCEETAFGLFTNHENILNISVCARQQPLERRRRRRRKGGGSSILTSRQPWTIRSESAGGECRGRTRSAQ